MNKKMLCLIPALVMVLTMGVPVRAEETSTQVTVANGGTATSELRATIEPIQLRVTVPTSVNFTMDITVDPENLEDGQNPATAQITCPEHAFVNESYVPVYARVASVTTKDVQLTNDPADLKQEVPQTQEENDQPAPNYIMLAYKSTNDEITSFDNPGDWLTTDSLPTGGYWLSRDPIPAKSESGNGELSMTLYGQAGQGWEKLDLFTVSPVIVISLTKTIPGGG